MKRRLSSPNLSSSPYIYSPYKGANVQRNIKLKPLILKKASPKKLVKRDYPGYRYGFAKVGPKGWIMYKDWTSGKRYVKGLKLNPYKSITPAKVQSPGSAERSRQKRWTNIRKMLDLSPYKPTVQGKN